MDTSIQRGLTLLELTVVVFILASLAALTLSVVDSSAEQMYFDETRTRLALLKRGIAGEPTERANGQPLVSGFVADTGRLPRSFSELLERGALPAWHYDPVVGQWAGWRGPYVEPLLERDESGLALRTFRDGWRNPGSAPLFGWLRYEVDVLAPGALLVQSAGADGREGGVDYAADFPPLAEPLLTRLDHELDVRGLTLEVSAANPRADTVSVRLRMVFPRDGSFTWLAEWLPNATERDAEPFLSDVQHFPAQQTSMRTFCFETHVGGTPVDKWIPWGARTLVAVDEESGAILEVMAPQHLRLIPRAAVPELPRQEWSIPAIQ